MLLPEQSGWPPEPPKVSAIAHGFQYLTENRQDEIDGILSVLERHLQEVGLPLRTMEDEWGPGQCEFTFEQPFICEGGAAVHVPGSWLGGHAAPDTQIETPWEVFRFSPPTIGGAVHLLTAMFLARGYDPLTEETSRG